LPESFQGLTSKEIGKPIVPLVVAPSEVGWNVNTFSSAQFEPVTE
jgi:hypothetical protein